MVWKPGSKHSVSSSRVIARRNDWNSIGDLHQGPRSMTASRGRIHDRSPIRLPKHQKVLAERGPSIHDVLVLRPDDRFGERGNPSPRLKSFAARLWIAGGQPHRRHIVTTSRHTATTVRGDYARQREFGSPGGPTNPAR